MWPCLPACRLDDLRRNYVLNKQNGLVIRPYKKVCASVD